MPLQQKINQYFLATQEMEVRVMIFFLTDEQDWLWDWVWCLEKCERLK